MSTFRVEGVIIPPKKHVVIGLTSVYGIGRTTAKQICQETNVDFATKVQDLSEEAKAAIQAYIKDNLKTEGVLRRMVSLAIKRLRDIRCRRGERHRRNLPVRGQRTKTNARTRKGPRGNKVAKKK